MKYHKLVAQYKYWSLNMQPYAALVDTCSENGYISNTHVPKKKKKPWMSPKYAGNHTHLSCLRSQIQAKGSQLKTCQLFWDKIPSYVSLLPFFSPQLTHKKYIQIFKSKYIFEINVCYTAQVLSSQCIKNLGLHSGKMGLADTYNFNGITSSTRPFCSSN